MTVKSWDRISYTGNASPGFVRPNTYDTYSQDGANATRAERLARHYKVHPYFMSRTRWSKPALKVHLQGSSVLYDGSTDTVGAKPVYPSIPYPSNEKAVAKLLSKWRNSNINIGVTVGEGREAAEMMSSRMLSIARSARELRRGNFGGALAGLAGVSKSDKRGAFQRMTTRNFASAWLELQYGWKPLLNDIYAASELFKPNMCKAVFRSSVKETGTILGTQTFPPEDVVSIKCERRLCLMVKVTNQASLPERLGLTDPFTIGWELTRFSFVADWFLPIGDSIAALHAKQVMKTSEASTTSILQLVSQFRVRAGHKYGNWVAQSDAVAEFNSVQMQRTVSFGVPGGWGIVDQIPGLLNSTWDPPVQRLFNAAALARTTLTRLR